MPRSIAIVVGLLTLVAPAIAERCTPPADDLWGAGAAGGNASRASYLEDFESFAVGGLAGHQGWSGWASNIRVIDDTPLGGMRSARHTSDGSGFVGFEIVSPTFTPAYGVLAATLRLSGANVTYQFNALGDQPTGHDGFYFNTAVQFRTDGTIAALQAAGGVGVFQDTAGTWTPGVPFQIAVDRSSAYWTNSYGGSLVKVPLNGGAPVTLAAGQNYALGIALSTSEVFWVNYDGVGSGGILRMPK